MALFSQTAKVSSKGQIVIPAKLRASVGLDTGDQIVFEYDDGEKEIRIRKADSLDEMAAKFTSYIKPGTEPLQNASEVYASRPIRD